MSHWFLTCVHFNTMERIFLKFSHIVEFIISVTTIIIIDKAATYQTEQTKRKEEKRITNNKNKNVAVAMLN